MKILQLLYSLASGGAERFVVDLSNQLSMDGHQVVICVLRKDEGDFSFNKQFVQPSVRLLFLGLSRGISLGKILQVEKCILREKPDIVHCHLNVVPYIYRLALFNKKIRFFHTLHNIAGKTVSGSLQYRLNKFFYFRKMITPVCISSICRKSYLEYYNADDVLCIDNGRSPVVPTAQLDSVRMEVSGYKTTAKTSVFIHVARYNLQKRQDLLVSAFNRLDDKGVDFVLLVIGDGFDTEEGKKLKKESSPKIHYLGRKSNVGDYLLNADAFCLTSDYEGLPISLLEALSCGVTPICTSVGGIPDVIDDGKTGYLAPTVDVDAYVHAIERFLEKPIDATVLKELYMHRFSMQECARKYLLIYNM